MKQRFSGFSSSSRSDLFLLPPTRARGQAHEAQGELRGLNIMPATILLVDDDDDIRYVTELLLSTHGYFVISCSAADLATVAFRDCPTISLLLTDAGTVWDRACPGTHRASPFPARAARFRADADSRGAARIAESQVVLSGQDCGCTHLAEHCGVLARLRRERCSAASAVRVPR